MKQAEYRPRSPARPRKRCDVCIAERADVRDVAGDELRETVAAWIRRSGKLCPPCIRRLGGSPEADEAD